MEKGPKIDKKGPPFTSKKGEFGRKLTVLGKMRKKEKNSGELRVKIG